MYSTWIQYLEGTLVTHMELSDDDRNYATEIGDMTVYTI